MAYFNVILTDDDGEWLLITDENVDIRADTPEEALRAYANLLEQSDSI